MKNYLLTLLLAMLVVLAAVTLRRGLAGVVGPGVSGPTNTTAIGVSPVPLPPTIAIGVSPVPLPPTARVRAQAR